MTESFGGIAFSNFGSMKRFLGMSLFCVIARPVWKRWVGPVLKAIIGGQIVSHILSHRIRNSPTRIILVQETENEADLPAHGNNNKPDHEVELTPTGILEASLLGEQLFRLVGDERLRFYCSPYKRTKQTLAGLLAGLQAGAAREAQKVINEGSFLSQPPAIFRASWRRLFATAGGNEAPQITPVKTSMADSHGIRRLSNRKSVGTPQPWKLTCEINEDVRLRDQEMGFGRSRTELVREFLERNFEANMYYRFSGGESGADVFDRVAAFEGHLQRDFETKDFVDNCVIVTHRTVIRVLISLLAPGLATMDETLPGNGGSRCFSVLTKDSSSGKYRLTGDEPLPVSACTTFPSELRHSSTERQGTDTLTVAYISNSPPQVGGLSSLRFTSAGNMPSQHRSPSSDLMSYRNEEERSQNASDACRSINCSGSRMYSANQQLLLPLRRAIFGLSHEEGQGAQTSQRSSIQRRDFGSKVNWSPAVLPSSHLLQTHLGEPSSSSPKDRRTSKQRNSSPPTRCQTAFKPPSSPCSLTSSRLHASSRDTSVQPLGPPVSLDLADCCQQQRTSPEEEVFNAHRSLPSTRIKTPLPQPAVSPQGLLGDSGCPGFALRWPDSGSCRTNSFTPSFSRTTIRASSHKRAGCNCVDSDTCFPQMAHASFMNKLEDCGSPSDERKGKCVSRVRTFGKFRFATHGDNISTVQEDLVPSGMHRRAGSIGTSRRGNDVSDASRRCISSPCKDGEGPLGLGSALPRPLRRRLNDNRESRSPKALSLTTQPSPGVQHDLGLSPKDKSTQAEQGTTRT